MKTISKSNVSRKTIGIIVAALLALAMSAIAMPKTSYAADPDYTNVSTHVHAKA